MLNAKVIHRYNHHDYGLYMWTSQGNIYYFHPSGYFFNAPENDYIIEGIDKEETEEWIEIIKNQLFRYQTTPDLLERLMDKRHKLKLHSNSLSSNKIFRLASQGECPICYNTIVTGDRVYSYHRQHRLHWACPNCYLRHQLGGVKPCPLCRQPF